MKDMSLSLQSNAENLRTARKLRPGVRQTLIAFSPSEGKQSFRAIPPGREVKHVAERFHIEVLPLGLVIWGATEETFVVNIQVGNCYQFQSYLPAKVPARYFEPQKNMTFERLGELGARGELGQAFLDRQILPMNVAHPGVHIHVETEGPFESLAMWGIIREGHTPLEIVVRAAELGGFEGEVIEHGFLSDRSVFAAKAVTESGCSELLARYAFRYG